ncbi:MAG: hypothetical protein HQM16_07755 [Deltaproteobacteria bacterium]|nr:hypothetical protein [Deltaproteobacteria bacterium]
MCGILGTFPPAVIDYSNLNHRGPDFQSQIKCDRVSFAHTRLSILDCSERAHQPIFSSSGRVLLVFNGEIYNFKDLDPDINLSDSVALVEWLEREGPFFNPAQLDGMYAFAAYFLDSHQLVLCRDPSGIKPLYVALSKNRDALSFSSEIKGFFGVEWFEPVKSLDQAVHAEFLQYGYALPKKVNFKIFNFETNLTLVPTLLDRVYQCLPGEKIIFSTDQAPIVEQTVLNLPAAALDPIEMLKKSVLEQSISDPSVEVGVQLSGGIDSSLVAYNYAQNSKLVHGFYVSVKDRSLNEDQWVLKAADQISRVTDFRFHKIELDQQYVLDHLGKIVWHGDEPVIRHPNAFGIYLLCEYVRRHTAVKVLLTGEGADEMFAGYPWHDGKTTQQYEKTRRVFDFNRDLSCDFFKESQSVLKSQLMYDRNLYLPPILTRQDRMSMAHAIESRVPFLSNRFLSMPSPTQSGKVILKREAERIFGREFAQRRKVGFGLPLEWFGSVRVPKEYHDWMQVKVKPKNLMQQWALSAIGLWSYYYLDKKGFVDTIPMRVNHSFLVHKEKLVRNIKAILRS